MSEVEGGGDTGIHTARTFAYIEIGTSRVYIETLSCPVCYPPFGAPTRRALPARGALRRQLRERASVMPDRTLVASWTPYEWRRAHERGSGGDSEVGQGADWREAIRAKVKEGTSL